MPDPTDDPNAPWRLPTRDEAAGYLYRIAQAETIRAVILAAPVPLDEDGKIIPTEAALAQARRENPILASIAA